MTVVSLKDSLPVLLTSIITLLAWLIPMVLAISDLRKRNLGEIAKALWVLIILLIPVAGPLVYFVLGRDQQNNGKA